MLLDVVLLDAASRPELLDEGIVHDVVNWVQKPRKTAGLLPTDDVQIQYDISESPGEFNMQRLVKNREDGFLGACELDLSKTQQVLLHRKGRSFLKNNRLLATAISYLSFVVLLRHELLPGEKHWVVGP